MPRLSVLTLLVLLHMPRLSVLTLLVLLHMPRLSVLTLLVLLHMPRLCVLTLLMLLHMPRLSLLTLLVLIHMPRLSVLTLLVLLQMPDASSHCRKLYVPQATVLSRCDHGSGCCLNHPGASCIPALEETVWLPFQKTVILSKATPHCTWLSWLMYAREATYPHVNCSDCVHLEDGDMSKATPHCTWLSWLDVCYGGHLATRQIVVTVYT
ncbi:hypothetical protein J6590_037227 [Homalodisca vitripennis]|nr:hypothetical protein J6590_037227 [Homalodisca vitripennis]